MNEGEVTVNPLTGAIVLKTGCVGEVFDALESGQSYGDTPTTNPLAYANAREQIANMARAIAKVIPHIIANATVTTSVAAGIPVATSGSATSQAGSTTAPGSGTGSVS